MNLKNSAIALTAATLSTLATAEIGAAIVTATDDPNSRLVAAGVYSGVARLSLTDVLGSSTLCTGSLLQGGFHILTAAHCLTDSQGNRNTVSATVRFAELTDTFSVADDGYFIFPRWRGDFYRGDDLAILKLTQQPTGVSQYDIYRDTDEVGQAFAKIGYGRIGTGSQGDRADLYGRDKISGLNRFDARGEDFPDLIPNTIHRSQLLFDFDSGNAANNFFPDSDLGFGGREVNTAPGDSGSPAFIGRLIAGITSYGERGTGSTDIDAVVNSSFGEYSSETRVSSYQNYIDRVLAGNANPTRIPASVRASASIGVEIGRSLAASPDLLGTSGAEEEAASTSIPESSSLLSLLVIAVWGAIGFGKRKSYIRS